jgi:hypothetical protein
MQEANLPAAIRRVKAQSGRIRVTVPRLIDKRWQIPDHYPTASVATGHVLGRSKCWDDQSAGMIKGIFGRSPGMTDRRRKFGVIAA